MTDPAHDSVLLDLYDRQACMAKLRQDAIRLGFIWAANAYEFSHHRLALEINMRLTNP